MARYMETELLRMARSIYAWCEEQITGGYSGYAQLMSGKPQRFTLGQHVVELVIADPAKLVEEVDKYMNPESGYE